MPILDKGFNAIVKYIGGRVPHTLTADQYPDYAAMKRDWEATGHLKINVGNSLGTIFGSASLNWLFRAWHDYAHVTIDADFSPTGEAAAAEEMKRIMIELIPTLTPAEIARYSRIIDAEVNAQAQYFMKYGAFPENQYEFMAQYLQTGTV